MRETEILLTSKAWPGKACNSWTTMCLSTKEYEILPCCSLACFVKAVAEGEVDALAAVVDVGVAVAVVAVAVVAVVVVAAVAVDVVAAVVVQHCNLSW